jgi:lysine/ornithine N-monooxygenase
MIVLEDIRHQVLMEMNTLLYENDNKGNSKEDIEHVFQKELDNIKKSKDDRIEVNKQSILTDAQRKEDMNEIHKAHDYEKYIAEEKYKKN